MDECFIGIYNCYFDVNCMNMKGLFYCICLMGYFGDGVLCEGIKYVF